MAMSASPGAQDPPPSPEVIVWSATRKLDWKDFKGKPPARRLEGALSAISHEYAVGCRDQVLQMRVQTVFVPDQSWVAARILSSGLASRVGIRHEQLHFDLAEVHARRMRKVFRELRDPCKHSDDALIDMAEKDVKAHWATQRRYDIDTENGQLEARQHDWERRVAADLAALEAFAAAPPTGTAAARTGRDNSAS
jgi:hypothetical protein